MPLYIEKSPITLVGMGTPFLIGNLYAHKVIDNDTSRIMKLSTIGAELNTLQHFGHNSRTISIRGRINLSVNSLLPNYNVGKLVSASSPELLLTGLRLLKETKSAVLLIMNHSICYGIIESLRITDDKDFPTIFDYELEIVEKDIYGLKISAVSQRILAGVIQGVRDSFSFLNVVPAGTVIPSFSDFQG